MHIVPELSVVTNGQVCRINATFRPFRDRNGSLPLTGLHVVDSPSAILYPPWPKVQTAFYKSAKVCLEMVKVDPSFQTSMFKESWWTTHRRALSLYWWKTKKTFRPFIRDCCYNFYVSTVPAADILACPQREPFRKGIWFISCIPLVLLTLSDLKSVMVEFTKYPVIYTYEYMTNNTLLFPDVTICNVNPFLKSKFCDQRGPAWADQDISEGAEVAAEPEDEKATVWVPFCRENTANAAICDWFCGLSNTTTQSVNSQGTDAQTKLAQWVKKMAALGSATQKLLLSMAHSMFNTVEACSYASNSSCGERNQTDHYFNEEVNDLYGSCFCFHCVRKQPDEYYTYGTLSTPLTGLVVTLNTELEEYLENSREIGFIVLIHQHGKKYSMSSDAVFVPAGYTTFVGLEMTQSTNLQKPYENPCIREWPQKLMKENSVLEGSARRSSYMREDCLSYCLVDLTIEQCSCIPTDTSVKLERRKVEDFKYCTHSNKRNCYETVKNKYGRHGLEERCGCLQECLTNSYRSRISISGFTLQGGANADLSPEAEAAAARIVVYYHSFTYEHVRAIPKYTAIRALGTIGAINGMYLGLSFYIIYQALDIIIFSAVDFIHRRKLLRRHKAKTRSKGIQASTGEVNAFSGGLFSLHDDKDIKHIKTRFAPYKTGGL